MLYFLKLICKLFLAITQNNVVVEDKEDMTKNSYLVNGVKNGLVFK